MIVGDRGRSWAIVRVKSVAASCFKTFELGFQVTERSYMVVSPVFHDRVIGLRWLRLMVRLVVDRHH